tara:strand:- start:1040 stop:1423 length:384 start_codon:yes stop_codon:yes gene_type:complete
MTELDLRYNLKNILRESGMTQLELAKKINISPTNLNTRLARGRNCQLSLLESICKTLDVDIEMLMYGTTTRIHAEDGMNINIEKEEEMYRNKFEEAQSEIIALMKENSELKDMLSKNVRPSKKVSGE